MFIKRRTRKMLSEVVPLLRDLYPDQTDEQRASILTLFSASHDRPASDPDQSHIDVLIQTLRYWGSASAGLSIDAPTWPGVEDVCTACQDFKAAMVEIQAGVKVITDEEGHVLSPITVEDHDSRGQPLSDGFKEWIVHGGLQT